MSFEHGKNIEKNTSNWVARSPVAGTRPASKHPCPGGIRGGIRQIQAVKHEKLEKTSLKQQKNLEKLGKTWKKHGKTGKNLKKLGKTGKTGKNLEKWWWFHGFRRNIVDSTRNMWCNGSPPNWPPTAHEDWAKKIRGIDHESWKNVYHLNMFFMYTTYMLVDIKG